MPEFERETVVANSARILDWSLMLNTVLIELSTLDKLYHCAAMKLVPISTKVRF